MNMGCGGSRSQLAQFFMHYFSIDTFASRRNCGTAFQATRRGRPPVRTIRPRIVRQSVSARMWGGTSWIGRPAAESPECRQLARFMRPADEHAHDRRERERERSHGLSLGLSLGLSFSLSLGLGGLG